MAKSKNTEKPVSEPAPSPKVKGVRLELPLDIHRRLRILAAQKDSHMSHLARIAVEEFLNREEAKQ